MQRKTPDKFLVGKGHLFFYSTAFVILVGESHRVFINRFDAVVADGDFMVSVCLSKYFLIKKVFLAFFHNLS